jgi:phosphoglycolate phosphatase
MTPVDPDLLVFDLDGTLCDSAPDISASLRRVLRRMGKPEVSHEQVVQAIGSGVRLLIERTSPPPHAPVVEAFMAEYAEHLLDETRLYPGVAETLERLPMRKVVLTNKPVGLARRVVSGLGIEGRFETVFGGDSFPVRKPDPACFRAAAGDARRPLMIGDSGVDVATGRNAGVKVCAVTYGYHKPGELDGADVRIDRFDQLLGLFR